ncbi:MAG: GYD domain-containing protein [Chloroflexota bacterium]|nr:MAG: GYD domain-containing protein [Chloroflexota bacterium]
MPRYMTQFAYTAEAWAHLAKNPVDRSAAIGALATRLGGKLISLDYTMGEYDGVIVSEGPDDITAMAIVIAAIAPGHVRATRTTRLYSPDEAIAAMKMAGTASYSAPS